MTDLGIPGAGEIDPATMRIPRLRTRTDGDRGGDAAPPTLPVPRGRTRPDDQAAPPTTPIQRVRTSPDRRDAPGTGTGVGIATGHPDATATGPAASAARNRRLVFDAYALTASSVGNALTGLLCYVLSARLYPQDVVGQAAGLTSGLVLISAIASLDLHTALQRFLPGAGRSAGRLVWGCYVTVAVCSAAAAVPFVLVFGADLFGGNPGGGLVWYPASVGAWSVFALQDIVLLGLGAAILVPVENLAFGLMRLGLVALLVGGGGYAVFASWLLPVALLIIVVNLVVWRRVLPRFAAAAGPGPPGWDVATVARFVGGSHIGNLVGVASANLLPLIVVAHLGTEGNAVFYIAWMVPYSLRMIAFNFGSSLLVHGSVDPTQIPSLLRTALRRQATLLVPVVVVILLFAHPLLMVFGPAYAQAANLLRLLSLSLIPIVVVSAYLPIARVKGRLLEAVAISIVCGIAELGGAWLGLTHHGLTGLGLGYLAADVVVALLVLPRLAAFLTIPARRDPPAAALAGITGAGGGPPPRPRRGRRPTKGDRR